MRTPRLRRRRVLGLLASLPAAGTLAAPARPHDRLETLRRICARAGRAPGLAALGRTWCDLHPEAGREGLLAAIAAEVSEVPPDERAVIAALRARAAADFREGRVVALRGWRLSLTEARICAAGVARD